VDYDARVNLGKHRVVYGFSWLLRVIDHEAALMDPKLFSSKCLGSQASGVVETEVWTADKQPVAQKNDWIVQVIPQQAINDPPRHPLQRATRTGRRVTRETRGAIHETCETCGT
jgi:hypothetical protein